MYRPIDGEALQAESEALGRDVRELMQRLGKHENDIEEAQAALDELKRDISPESEDSSGVAQS
jgi:predicted  nucleic acid-binding Zn-ribbon protein